MRFYLFYTNTIKKAIIEILVFMIKSLVSIVSKKNIFTILLILWILIAIFNIFYNTLKSVTEARQWVNLTDQEKRYQIFGDIYGFCMFINSNTPTNAHILIYSKDSMVYFLCRYYSFPRLMTNSDDNKQLLNLAKTNNFAYVVLYNNTISLTNYQMRAMFSTKTKKNIGVIYKKE